MSLLQLCSIWRRATTWSELLTTPQLSALEVWDAACRKPWRLRRTRWLLRGFVKDGTRQPKSGSLKLNLDATRAESIGVRRRRAGDATCGASTVKLPALSPFYEGPRDGDRPGRSDQQQATPRGHCYTRCCFRNDNCVA